MNTRKPRRLTLVCIGIFVLSQSSFGIEVGRKLLRSLGDQNNSSWFLFVPEDEEFTAVIPAWPTTRSYSVSTSYKTDRERILAHRQYGGYGNGLVFVIESFKAERPQRLWDDLLKSNVDQALIFERDITFDGVVARQYKSTYSSHYSNYAYTRRLVRFVTKEHVYFLTLATLDETDPAVDRFLSSFRLRRPQDRITRTETQSLETLHDKVFTGNEVTRKATVVWKPEPTYTEQARAHQVVGTVVLKAVFAANGYVTNIIATRELKDGLTEAAIEAARNIRFFPAEKEGKPVSQWMALEYNFNLF